MTRSCNFDVILDFESLGPYVPTKFLMKKKSDHLKAIDNYNFYDRHTWRTSRLYDQPGPEGRVGELANIFSDKMSCCTTTIWGWSSLGFVINLECCFTINPCSIFQRQTYSKRDLTEEKADLPFLNKIGRSAYQTLHIYVLWRSAYQPLKSKVIFVCVSALRHKGWYEYSWA